MAASERWPGFGIGPIPVSAAAKPTLISAGFFANPAA